MLLRLQLVQQVLCIRSFLTGCYSPRNSTFIVMLSLQHLRGHISASGIFRRNFSQNGKPFDKILIANRGEIACRVMRTAKRLGVKTVAVYSDADASNMHVRMADEAHWIGGAASSDSYLRMERIIEVAKRTGAQAIHPGYGFLSENAKFVDMVENAGIAFIGPSSAPMHAMGDKISSKKIAKDAGCFIIPGYEGEIVDVDHAVKLAREVGFPVMLKASAGGGGKGMRVAYNDDEVREGYLLSKAEAKSSFGDDRMLIERFIEDPHHIEIQILADTHGNVVAFPERECSVQRRNQKVVEESPSCLLTPATRRAMQEQAIALCKATNYRSAGTIEMLADNKQNFYFLEMNTRLQVEHPITELVSGEDLVEHMLHIAANKPLPKRLTDVTYLQAKGSAIESRVYAEDPLRGFLPSIGPLNTYKEPPLSLPTASNGYTTVRIDTGVFEGATISMHYDPMISKLCTHAPTREGAVQAMENALDQYVVKGLGNNITFLRSVFRNPKFRTGHYSTKFIAEQYPDGFHGVQLTAAETSQFIALAAAIHSAKNEHLAARQQQRAPASVDEEGNVLEDLVVVLGGPKGTAYKVQLSVNNLLAVSIQPLAAADNNNSKPVKLYLNDLVWNAEQPLAFATFHNPNTDDDISSTATTDGNGDDDEEYVDGTSTEVVVQYVSHHAGGSYVLRYLGSEQTVIVRTSLEHALSQHMLAPAVRDVSKSLLCPMPGTLISCSVQAGQHVEMGQQLAVVEAMKMQNVLRAERKGVVKVVHKAAGSHLKVDETIMEFE